MKQEISSYNKIGKKIFRKYKEEIDDIVLFGSSLKGKEKAKDLDILMIFKKKVNKNIESEFKNLINMNSADINSISKIELENDNFIAKEGIYLEGRSIVKDKKISDLMGFSSLVFVKYDISKITGSDRIRFYYALQGRNESKGFLYEMGAQRFSESVIVCDYSIIEKMKAFFDQWKIEYQVIPTLIPKRLRHILMK